MIKVNLQLPKGNDTEEVPSPNQSKSHIFPASATSLASSSRQGVRYSSSIFLRALSGVSGGKGGGCTLTKNTVHHNWTPKYPTPDKSYQTFEEDMREK
jgi:hypothetical protein